MGLIGILTPAVAALTFSTSTHYGWSPDPKLGSEEGAIHRVSTTLPASRFANSEPHIRVEDYADREPSIL